MVAKTKELPEKTRFEILDGMRGAAALLVVIYHLTALWTEPVSGASLYPYGDMFIDGFWRLRYFGDIGVWLFFLISGFVIMMTLQRCSGILDFAGRRFSRLWPTMLVCATLTTLLINSTGFYSRFEVLAAWEVKPLEYLLSILFINPGQVASIFGLEPLGWVDGVYWTLWAEVRFYAVIAATFWLLPRRYFLWGWLALQTFSTSAAFLIAWAGINELPLVIALILQPGLLAWFTLGIAGYFLHRGELSLPIILASGAAFVDILTGRVIDLQGGFAPGALNWLLIYSCVFAPFVLFLFRSPLLAPLGSRWVVMIGLASYPLYMFHERVGLIAITYLTDWGLPGLVSLGVTTVVLIAFAIAMSRYIEIPAKSFLLRYWQPFANRLQSQKPFLRFAPEHNKN